MVKYRLNAVHIYWVKTPTYRSKNELLRYLKVYPDISTKSSIEVKMPMTICFRK